MKKKFFKRVISETVIVLLCFGMSSCQKEEEQKKQNESPASPPEIYGFDANGASYAFFSVSPNKQVRFSRGNMQYQASTNTWRFAQHQYDCIGAENEKIASDYTGWIDLFGWGTSGWEGSGAVCYQPYSVSTEFKDYYIGGHADKELLTDKYAEADWAWHNAISNGGNKKHMWRVLTKEEWIYLLEERTDAEKKYAHAKVNDIKGLVILPDSLLDTTSLVLNTDYYGHNVLTKEQWLRIEKTGAVFLPVTGRRFGSKVTEIVDRGTYWSVTGLYNGFAWSFDFLDNYIGTRVSGGSERLRGFSVRPVQDI